jgi:Zn-finger nucleic acid-binding protein
METQRYCVDDNTPLAKVNNRGVTVDQCPRCGGIWLDAGELEMIISTIANQPGFHPRPATYYESGHHRTQRHHHRSSSDGLFGGLFGSS